MTGLPSVFSLVTWLSVAAGANTVYLTTVPPGLQFIKEQTVTFNCQGATNSSEWVIMRHVFLENITSKCGSGWGVPHGSGSCRISMTLPWDTGFYWCQSLTSGIVGEKHNFTVSDTSTILRMDSTTTPLSVGMDMTLTCLYKHRPLLEPVYFYKDDSIIARCPTTSNVTIRNLSKAHEGLYKCGPADKRVSPASWISVNEHNTNAVTTTTTWSGNITRDTNLCEAVSLYGGITTKPPNTDTSTAVTASWDCRGASTEQSRPREFSVYDGLCAYLGGVLFGIMMLAVSYLVFHMYKVTRTNIRRTRSLTPYTTRRRIEGLAESKV